MTAGPLWNRPYTTAEDLSLRPRHGEDADDVIARVLAAAVALDTDDVLPASDSDVTPPVCGRCGRPLASRDAACPSAACRSLVRERVRCRECGYETERFNGWAFCGPCVTPGKPGILHEFEAVEEET